MWHQSIIKDLRQNNYQPVINFYENIVENNPETITNYWYLGLAYLLAERDEDCQLIWLTIFSQIDDDEQHRSKQELLCI